MNEFKHELKIIFRKPKNAAKIREQEDDYTFSLAFKHKRDYRQIHNSSFDTEPVSLMDYSVNGDFGFFKIYEFKTHDRMHRELTSLFFEIREKIEDYSDDKFKIFHKINENKTFINL